MAHENGINGDDTDLETMELNLVRRTRFHVNRVDSLEGRASLLGEQETKKSLRHMTREALPRLDNYRNIMSIQAAHRPSLDELHNPTLLNKVKLWWRLRRHVSSANSFSWWLIKCLNNCLIQYESFWYNIKFKINIFFLIRLIL